MSLVSIVIPVYNEEEAIGDDLDLIKRTMDASGHSYEIIVVNDGSTDGTVDLGSSRPWVKLVHHERNRGNGAARSTGMKAAQGDIVIMTDGDGTYPNQEMPKLLEHMVQYDMVIGARIKEMGTMRWLRTPAKWFIRRLASYLTETEIPDLNSGLRAFRKDVIEWLMVNHPHDCPVCDEPMIFNDGDWFCGPCNGTDCGPETG